MDIQHTMIDDDFDKENEEGNQIDDLVVIDIRI